MPKYLVVLAILGATSLPASAQTSQTAPATVNQTQPAKPQMVKKRVCQLAEEDPYSRLGGRKICKTIEVPADQSGQEAKKAPQSSASTDGN
jgi:hypothetical protein